MDQKWKKDLCYHVTGYYFCGSCNFEFFFMFSILKVLDNHVVDYIPPEIMQKTQKGSIDRTKNGLLGMAIVGALSSDPRLV